ncbi:helicase with zinc finger domain 2-like [Huso huso]|uniref:Helicase with zinc finger domain 2-like n=1 Tax=Huso huso TaxID=61971 RepID=A0ABR0YH63_HUSHU
MNESQNNAIRQALKNSFTLIQGPPGTGKTVVGVHIVYWFHKMNLEASNAKKTRETNEAEETKKTCILYCGPSNKSVDVVAEYLLRFTETLRPLRVYSEQMEMIEFPYPGSILQLSRKSIREGKPKAELRSITLHHRIRTSQNPFSTLILSFDARIRREEDLTDEEVEQYKHILSKARQYELAKHDVILCTCTAAASPSLKLIVNPREILIDECAMATEPEALIPLVSYKPEKIVLLGDHKQLRPIVQNELLRKLGMEKSLFERYMDQAVMLDTQYRMHEEICAFPSMEFYKGRLKTDVIRPTSVLHAEWKRCTPILFGHVVGEEVSLVVSSEKGNENSKANLEEAEMAVRVAKLLINVSKVRPETIAILTPYNAQVSEIQKLLLKSEIQNVAVSTIMKSQGSEWRYVILSTVRSLPCSEIETEPTKSWIMKNLGFVTDPNQVNVGITRAQEGLCIIGNRNLLHCSSLWKKLLKHFTAKNCVVNAKDITVQKPRAR